MNYKEEIIKNINKLSGKYSTYEIFADWVQMQALSISQTVRYLAKREIQYLDIAKKYSDEEIKIMCEMNGLLTLAFEDSMDDVLGSIYMSREMGSSKLGQFFTPYHICQLLARTLDTSDIEKQGYMYINEPSTGAGGNIIAYCEYLKDKGYNYQTQVNVTAQDLDYKAVYMSYVQFSLLGIPAIVVQGNTLSESYNGELNENTFVTPTFILNNHFLRMKQ